MKPNSTPLFKNIHLIILIGISIILIIISKRHLPQISELRNNINSKLPFSLKARSAIEDVHDAYLSIVSRESLTKSNIAKKTATLLHLENQIQELASNLQSMQDFKIAFNFLPRHAGTLITGRIIYQNKYDHAAETIIKIQEHNLSKLVKQDDIVVVGNGLFGRVVENHKDYIVVLPTYHYLSRIPVFLPESMVYGIAYGTGSSIELKYLTSAIPGGEVKPTKGEQIITSSEQGLLMGGIPLGTISSISPGKIKVKPNSYKETMVIVFASGSTSRTN